MIQNPILTGFHPDPSICRVGVDYYIAVSTFEWFPGVGIYHSKDLANWTLVRRPLERLSQLNMIGNPDSGGVWAPCLSYADGQFWLIYSDIKVVDGQWKDGHNYLVMAKNIEDEWSEPIYLNSSGFDPSLYHDEESGKKYLLNMVWDARQRNHAFYGISLQEYNHGQQKLVGEAKVIFKGTNVKLTEAPHLYKINGYYYLLTAEGGTRYDHRATIARATSIDGPYELSPHNPLITGFFTPEQTMQKAGHASLVQTHTDEWYLVYLVGRPLQDDNKPLLDPRGYCPLGRETAISKLSWVDGWPVVVDGNYPQDEVEAPNITPQPVEKEESTTYFNQELPFHFQTLRQPAAPFASITERPGFLRLTGKESLTSKFTQAFVARRWQHFAFEAETKLEFTPFSFQQYAGLVNYYNTENWTALDVTHDEELGRVLVLASVDNGLYNEWLAPIQLPTDGAVYLKVTVNTAKYAYSYSLNGVDWTPVGPPFDSYKLSDDYVRGGGFFTGAFVGMHCVDLYTQSLPADFEYFRYEPK